jgi:hypothetical protein
MPPDVQDVVDDLAERLGRPVELEDRRWRLLAFSAHADAADVPDRVRQASILARGAPPEVAAWLDGLDLPRAGALVDTPPNPAIGMGPRVCAPVRHGDVLLAFLWVIPGSRPLDDAAREAVVAAARVAAAALWTRRASASAGRERADRLLAALLESDDADERAAAAAELRAGGGWEGDGACVVAIASVGDEHEAADVGARAQRRWAAGDLLWRATGTRLLALARSPAGSAPGALADALGRAGAAHAGEATAPNPLRARRAALAAEDALVVCAAIPALGPTAAASALGAWPQAARWWSAVGRPARPEPLDALLERRDAADLLRALEATLDRAGDVAAAARDLHVHRATLYRRLARAQEATGTDLARGDDVLRLHLAVRGRRLAGGR